MHEDIDLEIVGITNNDKIYIGIDGSIDIAEDYYKQKRIDEY